MTQTIEQLTARVRELELVVSLKDEAIAERTDRVRELEEENARLNSEIEMLKSGKRSNIRLGMEIAASQAYAEQLREALKRIGYDEACFEASENPGEWPVNVALEALSIPNDTSALDAYVAKRLHDMACDKGLLRIQVEELTRQRDLAVDALEKIRDAHVSTKP